MNYHEVLGFLATVIAFISYIPYFINIFNNRTKPHAFSWLVWFILTLIGFLAQLSGKAGPGAWVTGFTAVVCFIIFLFGLKKGRANIIKADWYSLIGAGIAILLWLITKSPAYSIILIIVSDFLGYLPTFRKSFHKPYEETALTFALNSFKYVVAFFALDTVSLITALYPAYLILINMLFVVMLLIRRKQLSA